jgi:hypothetical protein
VESWILRKEEKRNHGAGRYPTTRGLPPGLREGFLLRGCCCRANERGFHVFCNLNAPSRDSQLQAVPAQIDAHCAADLPCASAGAGTVQTTVPALRRLRARPQHRPSCPAPKHAARRVSICPKRSDIRPESSLYVTPNSGLLLLRIVALFRMWDLFFFFCPCSLGISRH